MKKRIGLFLTAGLLGCLLSACSGGTETEAGQPAPPVLMVNGETEAVQGTYGWNQIQEDGSTLSVCADSPHPLDCVDTLPVVTMDEGAPVVLTCAEWPDELTVRCWPESLWEEDILEADGRAVSLPVSGDTIPIPVELLPCVVAVHGVWAEKSVPTSWGDGFYSFAVSPARE